jgi:Tol biopolymer transport system component
MKGRRAGWATVALLASTLAGGAEAAFPGANGRIAFDSRRDGAPEIYVMSADGSGQTNLTQNEAFDAWPAWSPDGTRIAFETLRDGDREIYVMNADGSAQANLTNHPGLDGSAAWSPDGTRIAFVSFRDGNFEICVMNADGSGQVNLTNHPALDGAPAWSPDGSRIAFASERDGIREIYVMDADGSGQTRLTNDTYFDSLPDWSPDGTRIAFHSERGDLDIYVMNADGSDPTLLIPSAADPSWSPDGTRIAFLRGTDIHAANADGSAQVNLTNTPTFDGAPHWGPAVDSDGDGLPDDADPDTVGQAVDALPEQALHAPGHREAIGARLDDAEAAILAGDLDGARRMLENLRRHLDGCATSPTADGDDWIVDCAAQSTVRALLDTLLATLS